MNIKNLLLSISLLLSYATQAQMTRVQFINNCPDLAYHGFDIYIDGLQIVNDLHFRNASPFIDVNTNTLAEIGVAEMNSLQISDTLFRVVTALNPTNEYIFVINGIESSAGYSPSPPLSLSSFDRARIGTSIGFTSVLFGSGSTDAQIFDIRSGMTTFADELQYATFNDDYEELNSSNAYKIRITNSTGNKVSHTYLLDLQAANLDGKAITVLASGFINRSSNSNGEAFGLWYSDGQGGALLPLDSLSEPEALARVQFIHNSADTGVKKVDVLINNIKAFDSLTFRHATQYLDVFANTPLSISLSQSGTSIPMYSTSLTFDSAGTYSAFVYGISDSSKNYTPRPSLSIKLKPQAKEQPFAPGSADLLFMHGVTDGSTTDITLDNNPAFINNLNYGQFTNYLTGVTSHGAGNNHLITLDTGSTSTLQGQYILPYDNWGLAGKTVTIVSSGFINTSNNSNGADFGLWAAVAEGGAMRELPVYVSVKDIFNKSSEIVVWPNPAADVLSYSSNLKPTQIIITDISGKVIMSQASPIDNTINISQLPAGNYLLFIENNNRELRHAKFTK